MKVATRVLGIVLAVGSGACAPVAEVRVDGSPGVLPLVAELARTYESTTGNRLLLESGLGSAARVEAVASGRIEIAMASHGVDAAQLLSRGLVAHEIAHTAVVFAVNSAVPLRAITSEQVCAVLAGRLAQWQALDVAGGRIVALTRPPDEVDAEVAREGIRCLREITPGASVREIARPDSMATALATTAGAFGVTSMAMVRANEGRIAALELDGVEPTAENVASGGYPLRRSAYLITRADPPSAVARFLDFIRSAEGARIIAASGAVPAARIMRSS